MLRARRESSRRTTRTVLPSTVMVTSWSKERSSLPFGPSARPRAAATRTVTPAGNTSGAFPTRDMSLPDSADHLAADLLPARVAIDEHALRRREDVDAETAVHGGDLVRADVNAQARPADASDPCDDRTASGGVAAIRSS